MTPAQFLAELGLADRRYRRRLLQDYSVARAAAHADKDGDAQVRKALGSG